MAFAKGDPNINRTGENSKEKQAAKQTNRGKRQNELLSLARKLKPHISKSIREAARILDDNKSIDANKLKAAAFLFGAYKTMITEAYEDDPTELPDIQDVKDEQKEPAKVVSLVMLTQPEEEVEKNE